MEVLNIFAAAVHSILAWQTLDRTSCGASDDQRAGLDMRSTWVVPESLKVIAGKSIQKNRC